ncbi:NTP transferase domain-containing protein [Microbacterium sp. SS28]|uniref:nucleotidyltransferase family protein n=1 Tax=Microbacterium sp. SS28 TaxID=2919948 RepID=UPI001FAA27C9|nr:nucleotidyltransferase family protein [Microbacterium sp. SS28]
MSESAPALCGLVLAAGAGTRFGGPKALARTPDGTPWVARAVQTLTDAGCRRVVVALGAAATEARVLVPAAAEVVEVPDWAEGLSATLRAGLRAAVAGADAAVVVPVDTPELPASAVRRVVAAAGPARRALAQAVYGGEPGHPVFIGADHVDALVDGLSGDRGARRFLVAHGAVEVECEDLWSGADVDTR